MSQKFWQCHAALQKLEQAEAEYRATLPFLGDEIFVLIAAELDIRALGRLACVAQRFRRRSVPDPGHKKDRDAGVPELWSVVEEGARRQLRAYGKQAWGWGSRPGPFATPKRKGGC